MCHIALCHCNFATKMLNLIYKTLKKQKVQLIKQQLSAANVQQTSSRSLDFAA
jgi:hypothetical protein